MGTDLGQLVGTLPYMSPEQVGGDPLELDTRSDVYTLVTAKIGDGGMGEVYRARDTKRATEMWRSKVPPEASA